MISSIAMDKKSFTLIFDTIIPSKKNNQRILKTKARPGQKTRRWIAPGESHYKWHKREVQDGAYHVLAIGDLGITLPVQRVKELEITVYFPTKGRADTINKTETLLDFMTDIGVIADDEYKVLPRIVMTGKYRKGEPGAEVVVRI